MERTDDELISAYKDGDEQAFKELIDRYLGPIYAFTHRLSGREGDADDITQETFVKVWQKIHRYKMTNTFRAWIFAIARNTAIDRLRKKKIPAFSDYEDASGKNAFVDSLADADTLPATLIEKAEQKGLLDSALAVLSPPDREILTLHYGEELTFETIGKALKKPLNTVKSRHRRALAKLREFLERHE